MLRSIVLRALFTCLLALGFIPAANATYMEMTVTHDTPAMGPATVSVQVNGWNDDDGIPISAIRIYRNGVLVGSADGRAWASVSLSGLAPGTHNFVGQVINKQGGGATDSYAMTVLSHPPVVSVASNGTSFVAPATVVLSANATDADSAISKVEFFANGGLIGTDTSAPFAINWSNVAAGSYNVTAKATDGYATSATSSAIAVSVRNPVPNAQYLGQSVAALMQPGATQAVSVQMKNTGETSWSNATGYRLGWNDNVWGFGRVALPHDTAPGQTANFSFIITAPSTPGTYNFQWRMLQEGVTWFGDTSANVAIRVNAPPSITLNAPSGGPFTAPAIVGLSANASDPDGSINRVEFYSGSTLIGADTTAPYAMSWSGVGAGSHTVTAKVFDNDGVMATSGAVSVSVNNAMPSVVLSAPTGSPFIAPANIGLSATASDPDGSIAKVEFYAGTTLLAIDINAPYAYSWGNVAAGTYSLTAKAYDNTGAFTNSAPTSLTINSTVVIGVVDQVRQSGNGYIVAGWACSTGRNQSISVHLYAGGGYPSGTFVGAYTASLSSESAVAQACQAQGTAYRFQIPISSETRLQHAGKKIYIHGISPDGLANPLIDNSGVFSIPGPLVQGRRYVYDTYLQLCKVIEPETSSTVIQYDDSGNQVWSASGLNLADPDNCNHNEAWASDRVVLRDYDARNRLETLSFPDSNGDQVWEYEPDGLPKQITTYNDLGTTTVINVYNYNKRRLLTGESSSQPGWYTWGIGYGYNANGHLQNQIYPTGLNIAYDPNAFGQPTRAGSYAAGVQYYPNGAIKQFTYGNGIVHTMIPNARQLPARSTDAAGTLDHEYAYDPNGNVTSILDRAQGDHYSRWMGYDALDRLTDAGSCSFGGDCWHRFTYDSLDNIRSWKLAGVKDYASYYYEPGTNRLTLIQNSGGAGIVGIGYGVQGNVSNKNGQSYDFDYGNRLRAVDGKEGYRYDGQGRRVMASSLSLGNILSQYSQNGQVFFQEDHRKPGTDAQEHIYLAGSLVATRHRNYASGAIAVKYQHTDALGSPVAVTNEAGQVIDRTQYEPYGAAINKTIGGIGYTGHVMDAATGLTYMQQRYYDPVTGIFLSVDPVTANTSTGGNFNRYWYANNNPYRFTDPDGRAPQDNWYGFNDQRFRDWVHAEKQLEGRRGAQNYTKTDLKNLHQEWKGLGEPRGKGGTSGRGGGQRGFFVPAWLLRINATIGLLTYSSDLNAGEQEALSKRRQESEKRNSAGGSGGSANTNVGGSGAASGAVGGSVRGGSYNAQTGEAKVRLAPETGSRISQTVTVCVDKARCG